jgi:Glycosyl hydrolase family 63 C-terminal domain
MMMRPAAAEKNVELDEIQGLFCPEKLQFRGHLMHIGELHVDLLSWMGCFARTLKDVAEYLGYDDVVELRKIEGAIIHNLDVTTPVEMANEIYIGVRRNRFTVMLLSMILVSRSPGGC